MKSVTANQIAPSKPGEVKYKDRRLLVMFFDMTCMPIQDQLRAQTAAQKFLKTQMKPSDLMAVMTFSNELKVLQDFTDDRDALQKVVKGLAIGEGSDLAVDGSTGADNEADTGDAYTADDTEFNIFNTDRKLAALESAARMLGSLPEKKALVYFASGVSKTGVDNEAQLRATVNAAIRNNVSFFPIDARGLVASAPLGDATKASPGGGGMYSGSSARSQQSSSRASRRRCTRSRPTPAARRCSITTISGWASRQAQKAISSYYILGYYSANDKLDGRYRRIKLSLNNTELSAKIGKLDYRQGYFAGKEFGKFNSTDKERQLQEALMLGDPMTDLLCRARSGLLPHGARPLFRSGHRQDSGLRTGTRQARRRRIDQARFHRRGEGFQGPGPGQRARLPGDQAQGRDRRQLAKRTLAYDTGFTLAPGTYTLKFLTRENETGKMGTFETKFTVPDLTTQVKYVPISSVVLSNQRQPLSERWPARSATRSSSRRTRWCRTTRS